MANAFTLQGPIPDFSNVDKKFLGNGFVLGRPGTTAAGTLLNPIQKTAQENALARASQKTTVQKTNTSNPKLQSKTTVTPIISTTSKTPTTSVARQTSNPTATNTGLIQSTTGNINNTPGNITYEGLIKQGTEALRKAAEIQGAGANQLVSTNINPNLSLDTKTGLGGQIEQNVAAKTAALTGLGNAALSGAGLVAPVQLPYSSQLVSPTTGQPVGGAVSGTLNDAVNNVVSRLKTGTMTYDDAKAALAGYGQGGLNALQAALPANFNIAQSNTLAGQQGTVVPAYNFAKSALNNLKDVTGKLGILQQTNVPGINTAANWVSQITGLGSEKTRQYHGAVAEARNAYAQLLAASRGGTPTEYTAQANAAIPDNPTPNDVDAAIANLETLGQSKVNIYSQPGTQTLQPNSIAQNVQYNSDGTLRAVSF